MAKSMVTKVDLGPRALLLQQKRQKLPVYYPRSGSSPSDSVDTKYQTLAQVIGIDPFYRPSTVL